MDRCKKHRKNAIKTCTWCGTVLCRECDKVETGKTYCKNCAVRLTGG